MSLEKGARLGPYEIVSPLGAGGMGEVYRARDSRLGRDVALKVLPAEVSRDEGRLRRFEKEARAASALNHPSIVTIHEVGAFEATSYIAMELVEGKTLREILASGPLTTKRLLSVATPLAEGLAAAHEAGIVHRDLKPENVMVSRDGFVKILDFGLAKLIPSVGSGESNLPTVTRTEPGGLLGTVGYMSPEQAAGQPVDFRSDQFSLGAMLYEMATGTKAFRGDTAVDTLSAILHAAPAPIGSSRPDFPAPMSWVIERCLAKDPAERYAATRDLARDLATIRERSSEVAGAAAPIAARARSLATTRRALVAVALIAAGVLAGKLLWQTASPGPPIFRRLTFRRGLVSGARFTPDGQSVVYSAKWGGAKGGVYLMRTDGKASLPLPFPADAGVLGISPDGEAALLVGGNTLAMAPLTGGAPREMAQSVAAVDWSPATKEMAVAREGHLEFPLGKVLYAGSVDMIRFSPKGDRIAFGWSGGDVVRDRVEPIVSVVDLAGKRTDIGHGQRNQDLVWRPDGREVWYSTGSGWGNTDTIEAASLSGRMRVVFRVPGMNMLQDMSRDGRLLIVTGTVRGEVWCLPAGESTPRELGWMSSPSAVGLTADGKTMLTVEFGEGGGFGTAYVRKLDGSTAVKIADGAADAISPDGSWVAGIRTGGVLVTPVGAGEPKLLHDERFEGYGDPVLFFPLGPRILYKAHEKGRGERLYVQDLSGAPRALTTEGIDGEAAISPDGRRVAVRQSDGFWIYDVDGGERRPLVGVEKAEKLMSWTEDSRSLYVTAPGRSLSDTTGGMSYLVYRVDAADGRRTLWKSIGPGDETAIYSTDLRLAPNGAYALTVGRYISDLYMIEGLK